MRIAARCCWTVGADPTPETAPRPACTPPASARSRSAPRRTPRTSPRHRSGLDDHPRQRERRRARRYHTPDVASAAASTDGVSTAGTEASVIRSPPLPRRLNDRRAPGNAPNRSRAPGPASAGEARRSPRSSSWRNAARPRCFLSCCRSLVRGSVFWLPTSSAPKVVMRRRRAPCRRRRAARCRAG